MYTITRKHVAETKSLSESQRESEPLNGTSLGTIEGKAAWSPSCSIVLGPSSCGAVGSSLPCAWLVLAIRDEVQHAVWSQASGVCIRLCRLGPVGEGACGTNLET